MNSSTLLLLLLLLLLVGDRGRSLPACQVHQLQHCDGRGQQGQRGGVAGGQHVQLLLGCWCSQAHVRPQAAQQLLCSVGRMGTGRCKLCAWAVQRWVYTAPGGCRSTDASPTGSLAVEGPCHDGQKGPQSGHSPWPCWMWHTPLLPHRHRPHAHQMQRARW
eukprot:scaffold107060_cov17-Tisochrysis_lutea.AAC.3